MVRLPISKHTLPDKHWLVYVNDDGVKKHIDLSGCAGSFERSTGYVSQDGLRAVGWRYAQNGQLCYELFNVGHTVVWGPLQPNPIRAFPVKTPGKPTAPSWPPLRKPLPRAAGKPYPGRKCSHELFAIR